MYCFVLLVRPVSYHEQHYTRAVLQQMDLAADFRIRFYTISQCMYAD